LSWAEAELERLQAKSPVVESQILLMEILNVSRQSELLLGLDEEASESVFSTLQTWVERRGEGEPIQYIFGKAPFYGRDFFVGSGVLIPRPETEILVEEVLKHIPFDRKLSGLEIGLGSGAIALTLLLERADLHMRAFEVSEEALKWGFKNRAHFALDTRCEFQLVEGLEWPSLEGKVDFIVSNPPYIPEEEYSVLPREVRDHEPRVALVPPSQNPLVFYEQIADYAKTHLNPKTGLIALEVHAPLADQVVRVLKETLEPAFQGSQVGLVLDLSGQKRVVYFQTK